MALALYTVAAVWATWPGVRHVDGGHYLARPAAGYGEAAAGDHLQLGWSFWLVGHQLEHVRSPFADPYSFRPEASAHPNLQGWLYGLPFWPLSRAFGNVWAYNLVLLLSFLLAGGMTAWWLRSLDVGRAAALVGGLVFALAPYRLGQSTGHLLGLVAFLLPALLLALERRRLLLAALILCAIPLSGQPHLALGAIPLAAAYAWARLPPKLWTRVVLGCLAAVAAGLFVAAVVVHGSIGATRTFHQVIHYSATLGDFVRRHPDEGTERFVFFGWLVPLLALAGLVWSRERIGLRLFLGLAALVPALLALGANLPGYHLLWRLVPGLGSTRVPERLLPITCLAVSALVALAVDRASEQVLLQRRKLLAACALAFVVGVIAVDLRTPLFGAVEADTPNAAYAAMHGPGGLLELPVFRPDIHYGSTYLAYARQSPRIRPQGYSTLAPLLALRFAQAKRGLSCGFDEGVPEAVDWVAIHRGLYAQSRWFGADCPERAEAMLRRLGWHEIARDGQITVFGRPS